MVNVNFDGKGQTERVFIEKEDAYDAVISGVSDIRDQPVYQKPDKTEEKLTIDFTVKTPEGNKEIPMFAKPLVTLGSGTYSNSKMYDVLEKCGLLETFKQKWDTIDVMDNKENQNKAFVEFLQMHLLQKPCKVLTKTIKKGQPSQYTVVDKIINFGG